jgi:hypothetical protein
LEPFFRVYKISLQFFEKDDKKNFDSDNRHFVQVFFAPVFFDKVFDGKL